MKFAVIAHYHPDDIWDDNFIDMLRIVAKVADEAVVVTTSSNIAELPKDLQFFKLVRRSNVGYDFYSYRVGVHMAFSYAHLDGLFLINSSFFLLNTSRFEQLLRDLSCQNKTSTVRGLTSSTQFGWHINSYLMYFDLQKIDPQWVKLFFDGIKPVNTKLEVVHRYEIGLGQVIKKRGEPTEVLFKPTLKQKIVATLGVIRSPMRGRPLYSKPLQTILSMWRNINWSHFGQPIIAKRFGIAKIEVLRTNPHRLPTQPIFDAIEPELRQGIDEAINTTKNLYSLQASGLTELSKSQDPMDIVIKTIDVPYFRTKNTKIAVVLHLFYIDLFEEILGYLSNILDPYDLFITTPFEGYLQDILEATNRFQQSVTVFITKNKGRDVGPFISLYRSGRLNNYDYALKLHSKKSLYSGNGNFWRKELYEPLCGSSLTVLRSLALIRDHKCGIVGPSKYYLTNHKYWGANRERLQKILNSCGVNTKNDDLKLGFFAGTMFWFAPCALALIHHCAEELVDFEAENGKQDGTLAHTWERAFALLAKANGYRASSVDLNGQEIDSINNEDNSVPVI